MGSPPVRLLAAYRSLFDHRGTRGFVAAGFVSRLTASMAIVGLLLAITRHGGGYATAGSVVAALTLANAVMLPVSGRLIDQYGQHRVLIPTVLLAAAAGVPMPVMGPLVRARWVDMSAER